MNGTELKKNENTKKKQNIKIVFCILTSNILMFLLINFFSSESKTSIPSINEYQISHSQHEKLNLNLELKAVFAENEKEIPITLYSEDKKLLVEKAFLHIKPDTTTNEESNKTYIVEIPQHDLGKIIHYSGNKILAYPLHIIPPKTIAHSFQGESYEISF